MSDSQLVLPLKNHMDIHLTMSLSISNGVGKDYKALDFNIDTGSCDLVFQSHKCPDCDEKASLMYTELGGGYDPRV